MSGNNSRVGAIVLGTVLFTTVILCIALIPSSYVAISQDEACEVFYMHTSDIEEVSESGAVWKGPGVEKHCVSKATQHLSFQQPYFGVGLDRVIKARTKEGLEVTLEVDVEYTFIADRISETVPRTGFDNPTDRLFRTARAELRNAASKYGVQEYLTGERSTISDTMQVSLQDTFTNKDKIYINIVKVNLLHISVYPDYEANYQLVEDRKLQQEVEMNHIQLIELNEKTLLEQARIASEADRNKRVAIAEAATVTATLVREREITEAETTLTQSMIEAESRRITEKIRANGLLVEEQKTRDLALAETTREAHTALELATTDYENMIILQEGELKRAAANRERDLVIATRSKETAVAELSKEEITAELLIFDLLLANNLTVAQLTESGKAAAAEEERTVRAKTEEFRVLQSKLHLTDEGLARLFMQRALKRSTGKTVMLDYEKTAFLSEFGTESPTVTVSP